MVAERELQERGATRPEALRQEHAKRVGETTETPL